METIDASHRPHPKAAVLEYDNALFVALELSRSSSLLGVNVADRDKISRYRIAAGQAGVGTAPASTILAARSRTVITAIGGFAQACGQPPDATLDWAAGGN